MSINWNDDDSSGSDPLALIAKMRNLHTSEADIFKYEAQYLSFKTGSIELKDGTAFPDPARGRLQVEIQKNKIVLQYLLRPVNEIKWSMVVDPYQMYAQYYQPPQYPRVLIIRPLKPPQITMIKQKVEAAEEDIKKKVENDQVQARLRFVSPTVSTTTSPSVPPQIATPVAIASNPLHTQPSSSITPSSKISTDDDGLTKNTTLLPSSLFTSLFPGGPHPTSITRSERGAPYNLFPMILFTPRDTIIEPTTKHFWLQEEDQSLDYDLVTSLNRYLRPGLEHPNEPPPSPQPTNSRTHSSISPGKTSTTDTPSITNTDPPFKSMNPTHATLPKEEREKLDEEVCLFPNLLLASKKIKDGDEDDLGQFDGDDGDGGDGGNDLAFSTNLTKPTPTGIKLAKLVKRSQPDQGFDPPDVSIDRYISKPRPNTHIIAVNSTINSTTNNPHEVSTTISPQSKNTTDPPSHSITSTPKSTTSTESTNKTFKSDEFVSLFIHDAPVDPSLLNNNNEPPLDKSKKIEDQIDPFSPTKAKKRGRENNDEFE